MNKLKKKNNVNKSTDKALIKFELHDKEKSTDNKHKAKNYKNLNMSVGDNINFNLKTENTLLKTDHSYNNGKNSRLTTKANERLNSHLTTDYTEKYND